MIKFASGRVKQFLTAYGIEDDVYRLSVVFEDIYENEPQWMTDRNYLREAITLYVLRIYTKSLNRWGRDGEEIFRCLTDIHDVRIPSSNREAWEKFRCLTGYSVPRTLDGDVDLTRVTNQSMHWHIDNEFLGRVCDALFENVKKAAETFK